MDEHLPNIPDDNQTITAHSWYYNDLEDRITGITTSEIDKILNGQADLHGREKVDPTIENLVERYMQNDMQAYAKKMDTLHDDMGKMMPPNAQDRDIDRPVQINQWQKEAESYNAEKDKYRNHYLVHIPDMDGQESIVVHYVETELVEPEQERE